MENLTQKVKGFFLGTLLIVNLIEYSTKKPSMLKRVLMLSLTNLEILWGDKDESDLEELLQLQRDSLINDP